jgi:phosphoserine phosphatase
MAKKLKTNEHGAKIYDDNLPIIAICYDFDRTLSPKEMQEYTIIPKLEIAPEQFWNDAGQFAEDNLMDRMLSYMFKIVDLATKKDIKATQTDFKQMGQKVELFNGVDTWFDRINAIGTQLGVHIEHYIISAGLKEIIDGTSIAKYFEEIYASSFYYDAYSKPVWVRQVVNASSKTQYLFRVNKGCLDLKDERAVHDYMHDSERRIPFSNIIYIGDSDTDIPAMKVVTSQGGYAIGVYNPSEKGLTTACRLFSQERIAHFAPADYSENSGLQNIIETILKSIKGKEEINAMNRRQKTLVELISEFESYFDMLKKSVQTEDADIKEVNKLISQSYKVMVKAIKESDLPVYDTEPALIMLAELKKETEQFFSERKKQLKK